MGKKATGYFIIGTFVTLYLLVSVISTIHVIDFFMLSNPSWLAISLAIAFEVGAAASLASLITLEKMNKGIVWGLFIILTAMQAMGNTYYAFTHLQNFQGWIELFGLVDEELIYQKRILSIVSGAILPIVALGFIKSLVDYIKPEPTTPKVETEVAEPASIFDKDGNDPRDPYSNQNFTETTHVKPKQPEPADELFVDEESYLIEDPVETDQPEPDQTQQTTVAPRIDKNRSIDELIARGLPLNTPSNNLKKPFDP